MTTLLVFLAALSSEEWIAADDNREAYYSYKQGLVHRGDAAKARPYFIRSAEALERMWESGRRESQVARIAANAYLLAGELGLAIRWYHRGLLVAPHDAQLLEGLQYARTQVEYPTNGKLADSCRPPGQGPIMRLARSVDFWAVSSWLYLIGWLALARAWMTRRALWRRSGIAMLTIALGLAAWKWWEEKRFAEALGSPVAIVAENNTPLRRGNGDDFPLRFNDTIPAGVEMRILAERGGWLQVQLAGGEIGWIDGAKAIKVDDPPRGQN